MGFTKYGRPKMTTAAGDCERPMVSVSSRGQFADVTRFLVATL